MWRVLFVLLFTACAHAEPALPERTLRMNHQDLIVEVASTEAQHEYGLMNRRMLPENRGMLFVFGKPVAVGMWMKNTYIPLSVAFLDEHGIVINIEDMQPQTENVHYAARPAKFAIEANLGWFAKHGVSAGAYVEGLERVPPAQ